MTITHEPYAPSRDYTQSPELEPAYQREVQPFVTPHDAVERLSSIPKKLAEAKAEGTLEDIDGIGHLIIVTDQKQTPEGVIEINQVMISGGSTAPSYIFESKIAPTGHEVVKIEIEDPIRSVPNIQAEYVGIGTASHTDKKKENQFLMRANEFERQLLQVLDDPEVDDSAQQAVIEAIAKPSPDVLQGLASRKRPMKGVMAYLLGRAA